MTPALLLDDVIARVQPLLEESGYRKLARSFVSTGDGVARVVAFQTSQLKKPDEASFTLAVAVTSVAFHEAYAGTKFPRNAGSAEPVIQAQLGKLMPDGEPVWWSLQPQVSAQLVAGEVSAVLRETVLPFLARFSSEDALLEELSRGAALPGFGAMRERCRAALLAKRGRNDEARAVLDELLAANNGEGLEGFRASIAELKERLKL